MLRLALLSTAVLFATPALAEPISLTLLGVNALLGTSLTASTVIVGTLTVGQAIGTALVVGASLLASAFNRPGKARGAIDPSAARSTFETSQSGEIRCVGRVRIGGVKLFGNTALLDRWRLIGHCRGPISGVEEHYLGGKEVIVETDGRVSTPPYRNEAGSYVYIYNKPGFDSEISWPGLIAAFPQQWTAAHRVRGIAQSAIRYVSPGLGNTIAQEKFQQLYQSGPPEYERVQRGELIYDPRTGSSAWSDNGVLVVLHILLGFPEFELADFDVGFIGDEADKADEAVPTRLGLEPRSRAWGLWDDAETNRGDLLGQVLLSTGCELVARPGDLMGIRLVDDVREPEITIATRHIVDFTLKAGPDGVERPNRCRVKYYSPERNFDMAEIHLVADRAVVPAVPLAWSVAQAEIDRVGERSVEYSLPFCPSAAQAQRIARRLFATARADSGIAQTNMAGLACWGLKTVAFEVADLDLVLSCEVQPARVDDEAGRVEIPFVVLPALSAWNVGVDEALPPDDVPDMQYFSQEVAAPTSPPSLITVVLYPIAATFETRVGFPSIPGGLSYYEAVFRRLPGGLPTTWQGLNAESLPYAWAAGSLVGQDIEIRYRLFDLDVNPTPWSPILASQPTIDNTPLPAPSISAVLTLDEPDGNEATITVTAPSLMRVAGLTFTGIGAPGLVDARPGQVFTWTAALPNRNAEIQIFTFTATALTSNGTTSPVGSATVTLELVSG